MRWNTRSAPVRSTRMAMPVSLASKVRAIRSDSGRSTEVYQTTLPSFLAASINAGVIVDGSGACARIGEAGTVSASAPAPLSTSRRDSVAFMGVPRSHAEDLGVARFDVGGRLFDSGCLLLHHPDLTEPPPTRHPPDPPTHPT